MPSGWKPSGSILQLPEPTHDSNLRYQFSLSTLRVITNMDSQLKLTFPLYTLVFYTNFKQINTQQLQQLTKKIWANYSSEYQFKWFMLVITDALNHWTLCILLHWLPIIRHIQGTQTSAALQSGQCVFHLVVQSMWSHHQVPSSYDPVTAISHALCSLYINTVDFCSISLFVLSHLITRLLHPYHLH